MNCETRAWDSLYSLVRRASEFLEPRLAISRRDRIRGLRRWFPSLPVFALNSLSCAGEVNIIIIISLSPPFFFLPQNSREFLSFDSRKSESKISLSRSGNFRRKESSRGKCTAKRGLCWTRREDDSEETTLRVLSCNGFREGGEGENVSKSRVASLSPLRERKRERRRTCSLLR